MKGIASLIFLTLIFAEIWAERCPRNEIYDKQRANACQETCTNKERLKLMKCAPKAGCICREGYVRDPLTMRCIPRHKCPKICPDGEVYSECSGDCQPDCSSLYEPFICTRICKRGCICPKGYVRDWTGKCIPKTKCPKCGQNEKYSSCAAPTFCQKSCGKNNRMCPLVCRVGCICKENFVRKSDKNSTCIPENQCP